ncbi:MAG: hypothetical protein ACRENP_10710 [Longimicrobiales bacterium]
MFDQVVAATQTTQELEAEAASRASNLDRIVRHMADARVDAKSDTRNFHAVLNDDNVLLQGPQGIIATLTDTAHNQLAAAHGIDLRYYRRMKETQPRLLAQNIETWLHAEPDTRLFRFLRPTNAAEAEECSRYGAGLRLRGYLSKTYRPIDNADFLAVANEIAKAEGCYLSEFNVDDRRLFARFLRFKRDKAAANVGEPIEMGFSIRNSEIGFAAVDVASYLRILSCRNGATTESALRVRHVGKRNGNGNGHGEDNDVNWLSSETQTLENAAILSRLRDACRAAVSDQREAEIQGGEG